MRARCAGVRTHKFQKPEKRLAAVVPRCAGKCRPRCAIAAVKALCRLTACEIKRYRCRRRAFRWLAEALKEALCRRTAHTNERHPWASKPLRRAGGGRKQTLSAITGDDLDKIAHLRADGRLHTQAWCANGCRPQCATAADEPPRRSTGV